MAHAPHSGYAYPERQLFYQDLVDFVHKQSSHGPKMVCGDFNARLYQRLEGEEDVIGPYVYENVHANITTESNRHLLVETCVNASLFVANSFVNEPPESVVTCYNIGYHPRAAITWESHSQIDFILCDNDHQQCIRSVKSYPCVPLASHHFLLEAVLEIQVERNSPKTKNNWHDVSALQDPSTSKEFAEVFNKHMEIIPQINENRVKDNVDQLCEKMVTCFQQTASEVLPKQVLQRKQPWISANTLQLLQRRQDTRIDGNFTEEKYWQAKSKNQLRVTGVLG